MTSPFPAAALRGRRILVVEDDFILAEEMQDELERHGAAVVGPVARVEDALALLAGGAPVDGAVLDVNLRGELVFPVAEALARQGVPFVFLTGYDRTVLPQGFAHVDCFEKPVTVGAFVRALGGPRDP